MGYILGSIQEVTSGSMPSLLGVVQDPLVHQQSGSLEGYVVLAVLTRMLGTSDQSTDWYHWRKSGLCKMVRFMELDDEEVVIEGRTGW